MAENTDKISIGDVSGGNVAVGSTVGWMTAGAASDGQPSDRATAESRGVAVRLGFVVDVVAYGQRSAGLRRDIEDRLHALVPVLVADAGVEFDATDSKPAGDGMAVFFPAGIDPTRALPDLLRAASNRLALDNERYRDRMRLRMAVGSGLVGSGPMGLTGGLIVDLNRLLDSHPLRQAVTRYPDSDVVVLIANALYDDVVGPGYLRPTMGPFHRVAVKRKEFVATAWLWTSTPGAAG